MTHIFLKDMAYRRTRVVMTVIGIVVLITLILLLGGIMNGMRIQVQQYIRSTEANLWISAEGSGGGFTGFSLLVPEYLIFINHTVGVKRNSVSPLIFAHARPVINGKATKSIVVGYKRGKLGGPTQTIPNQGRMFTPSQYDDYRPEDQPPAEVVIDEKMRTPSGGKIPIGGKIYIGGTELNVVGRTKSLMFVLDTPLLFMDLRTAQEVLLKNSLHVNMMIAKTESDYSAEALAERLDQNSMIEARTLDQTLTSIIENYVDEPMKAVQFLRVMLWLAAGIMVTMIAYVTTLEKTREIGTLKAIGASDYYIVMLILKQVILMSSAGVILGVFSAFLSANLAPIFVKIDLLETSVVAIISFVVCCSGGYFASRKALDVDPMIAFRGEF